ncbi:hypothetical protein IJG20_02205 [Candidatus Saccharibacteria bacterium]|nr:hypothetical protein [Candidatus Saccharibacteria bacterium]
MSKKLIAGAGVVASLAVALAPMASFAAVADATWNSDQHTDTLNVTVLPTCAFGAASATPVVGVAHNAASNTPLDNSTNAATWTNVTANDNLGMTPDAASQTEHVSADSAAYSIYAGTADANMGETILKVVCNQNAGYKIYVEAENLEETGGDTIDIKASPSATVTGYNITTADTDSRGATTANVTSTTKTAAVTLGQASNAAGDTYTFTYGIGVAPGTKAATYTGDVVYTLVQQINS